MLDLKTANCGAFLVQFFAVHLVALHAKSSAYERIEQTAAKQGDWKLYVVAFCVELMLHSGISQTNNKHEIIQSHYKFLQLSQ